MSYHSYVTDQVEVRRIADKHGNSAKENELDT